MRCLKLNKKLQIMTDFKICCIFTAIFSLLDVLMYCNVIGTCNVIPMFNVFSQSIHINVCIPYSHVHCLQ